MRSTAVIERASTRLLAMLVILAPASASADAAPAGDPVLAETLFREGKALMNAKQFELACPKLAESYRIDRGMGTLLALALCHEGQGKLASAWIELTGVLSASADTRPDRAFLAREHIAAIEPHLSRLTVNVDRATAETAGLEIVRDGARLDRAAWGSAVPVDGGTHTIEARAPNHAPWSMRVEIASSSDRRVIDVPALAANSSATSNTSNTSNTGGPKPDLARLRWGIASSALGAVGLGVGLYFGVMAITKVQDAKAQCPTPPACTNPDAISTNKEALRDATIADIAAGVGAAASAVGLYLLLWRGPQSRAGLRVTPSFDRFGGGVDVRAHF